jgi:hypothetical protein
VWTRLGRGPRRHHASAWAAWTTHRRIRHALTMMTIIRRLGLRGRLCTSMRLGAAWRLIARMARAGRRRWPV